MTTFKSAALALTAMFCAATMAGAAQARGGFIGGGGGHIGHMAPMGHVGHVGHASHIAHMGHMHGGHHHHHHGFFPAYGFGIYDPDYYYAYDDEDCYRVYRHHHWRIVCD
jgi:hypothetical protein